MRSADKHGAIAFALWCLGAVCAPACAGEVKVCIRDACVAAEVADTPRLRAQGLMGRESLPEGAGMWFVFEKPQRPAFWMGNMRFPIDIIWVDPAGRVEGIHHEVPACASGECPRYLPQREVTRVLEVPAGFARLYAIEAGDEVVTLPAAASPRRSDRD